MSEIRKLAAVLFADIKGYTAAMQHDEVQAMTWLQHFKHGLESEIPLHGGSLDQYYGDGCLATFDSAAEATRCAIRLQQRFANGLDVPVRIGLHSGDVLLKDNNVYGDSVNIASRIESLGVPGAVLISKSLRDQIRSRKEFHTTALGSFDLKNVVDPVAIYALTNNGLVVPAKDDLPNRATTPSILSYARFRPGLFWTLAVVLLAFLYQGWHRITNSRLNIDRVQNTRIAVVPFENKTNIAELNYLGAMASDWITQGISELDYLQVTSYQTVRDMMPKALQAGVGNAELSRITGATKVMRGSYYLSAEKLIVQSQIVDVRTGDIDFVFPEVSGRASNPEEIVKNLRQRVMSFYEIKFNLDYANEIVAENPPKYEAYKAYLKGLDLFGVDYPLAIGYFTKAIEIDSTFFWPHLGIAEAYSNKRNQHGFDSIMPVIYARFQNLKPYEQLYYDWLKLLRSGDLEARYHQAWKLYEKDPKNLTNNYHMVYLAMRTNRPNIGIECAGEIAASSLTLKRIASSSWHEAHAFNLMRVGRFDEALEILNLVPDEMARDVIPLRKAEIFVLTNREDSLQKLITKYHNLKVDQYLMHSLYFKAAETYALINDREKMEYWAQQTNKHLTRRARSEHVYEKFWAETHFIRKNYEKAIPLYEKLVDTYKSHKRFSSVPFLLMRLAVCHHFLGNTDAANFALAEMKKIDRPGHMGKVKYALAQAYSMLGDNELAVDYLKQSYAEGQGFNPERQEYAYEFIPLQGFGEFERFVAPKG